MSLRGAGKAVLLLAGVMMLVSGVGWQEPALAAGPRFDPPLLPGLDVVRAQEIRDCFAPVFLPRSCGWWVW